MTSSKDEGAGPATIVSVQLVSAGLHDQYHPISEISDRLKCLNALLSSRTAQRDN